MGRVEEYEVVVVSVVRWRRMEMPFLKETVADRRHCGVVVTPCPVLPGTLAPIWNRNTT